MKCYHTIGLAIALASPIVLGYAATLPPPPTRSSAGSGRPSCNPNSIALTVSATTLTPKPFTRR